MREFRVWDKENKKMYYPGDYPEVIPEGSGLIPMDMEGFMVACDGSLALMDECSNYMWVNPEQFIVLKKIGMQDNNNNDIYLGDIVLRLDKYYDNDEIGVVVFESPSYSLLRDTSRDDLEYIEWPTRFFVNCEVKGNVFENPELVPDYIEWQSYFE